MCFKALKDTDLKEEPKRPDASRRNLCVSGYESESKIMPRQMFQEPWKEETWDLVNGVAFVKKTLM